MSMIQDAAEALKVMARKAEAYDALEELARLSGFASGTQAIVMAGRGEIARAKAALYDHMQECAEAAGFDSLTAAITAARLVQTKPHDALDWAVETFGAIALDRQERAKRLLEEAMELAQAEGVPDLVVHRIEARVYSRPPGDTKREIGQTMSTLAVLAANLGINAVEAFYEEFDRVRNIPKTEWAARHAAKVEVGIA